MAANIFGQGRRRLTLFYSLIMCVFLIALIFIAHKTLEWSIFSEQARELLDTAGNVAEAQAYFNQHPGLTLEDAGYKSTNDRLFFYVFNQDGRLSNFARASFHIEPFILDVVSNWQAREGEVSVFGRKNEREQVTRIMMTAKTVVNDDGSV
ncbi:MAG: sensor histidine kinase, partial [Selenomonas sp.]|nr:sensor histidine kinase [Selenomonas sp.]